MGNDWATASRKYSIFGQKMPEFGTFLSAMLCHRD